MTEQATIHCDIAVVGGGMVGAAAACGLLQAGFRVALLERQEPELAWPQEDYDIRVSALTRASQHLLENLGAWEHMRARRVTPYAAMQVWDRAGFGEIRFDAADIGEPDLGHIVENRVIQAGLWEVLREAEGLTLVIGRTIEGLDATGEGARLRLDDGTRIDAGVVLGADGGNSRIRELAGIETRGWQYGQRGIVATVASAPGNAATAWQRFMPTGPLALLPLDRDRFSIVWSAEDGRADELLALDDDTFNASLNRASEGRAGELRLLGPRAAFPLRLQRAESYCRPGLALLGDAAHVIHPLAGQGVNLGFLDAGVIVDVMQDARERGRPLGGMATLRRYERWRKGHNLLVQAAMDGFKRLFSNNNPGLGLLRNLGMGLAGQVSPVRRLFEQVALGAGQDLPPLNRRRGG